jgi:hypothetical protein
MAINPFQAPINYAVDVQSPFEAALGGFKLGAGVAEVEANRAARERAITAQTALGDLFKNPNATAADYARVTAFLPKDQAAIVQQGFEAQTKEQQQNTLRIGTQAYTAIKSGNLDVAQMQLQEQAAALRNAGREKEAQGYDDLSNLIRMNPTGAQTTIGLSIAQLPGGTDFLNNADKALSIQRQEALQPSTLQKAVADANKAVADATTAQATATNAAEKAAADAAKATADANKAKVDAQFAGPLAQANLNLNSAQIKNINSEISNRAARLNLDTQTMQATVAEKLSNIQKNLTDLPADTRKLVNESAVAAAASKQAAGQYNDLAQRLEAVGGGYGAFSSASELVKKGLGLQGGMSQLRQEYTRIRNSAAIKSLPAGAASDSDIKLALQPFPADTADAKYMASFLRGMAKLQDIESSVANAKTDWLSSNNGVLTRAGNTFQAGDYATKPGESFSDFTQRVVKEESKKYRSPEQIADERRQQAVAQIPTKGTPAPTQQVDVRSQADAILRGGQ